MPNPNDPNLEAEKKQIGQQLDQLRQQLENTPDDQKAGIQQQIDTLEQRRREMQPERQAAREQNRQQGGQGQGQGRGGGRDNAPGQQGRDR